MINVTLFLICCILSFYVCRAHRATFLQQISRWVIHFEVY